MYNQSLSSSIEMSLLIAVFFFFILIFVTIYYVSTKKFQYWKKKGVPHLKPVPILGNYGQYILLQKYFGQVSQKLCQEFRNEPYFGTYYGTEPALTVLSPELLKLVFTKDFYYFNSRDNSNHNFREVITRNVFFNHGDKWKIVRQNLTPLFSSLKMKNMFYLIEKCALALESTLDIETAATSAVEARPLMIRYTMDCICSCAFGVNTNTLVPDPKTNPYTKMGNLIFTSSIYSGMKWIARCIWPGIFYRLGFKYFSVEISEFFSKLLHGVFEERKYKPSGRNDFIDLVLTLKQKETIVGDSLCPKHDESKRIELTIDNDLLVAQCIVFFAAGFETSASTLTGCLYEFAKNQKAQRKAQEEIDEYMRRHDNKLKYECVTELPYLEICINEAIRLYPVLPVLTREVVEDYTFPTGLKVEKGLRIHLPVYYFHHNPDYFPDPEEFRPERFLPDAKDPIKPFTFFPFGEGPRICMGMRFAKMQVTAGLITFLKKYNVELAEGTPKTLEFKTTTMLTQPTCNIALKVTPRKGWEDRVFAY